MAVVVCVKASREELRSCGCWSLSLLSCSVQRISIGPGAVGEGWEVRASQAGDEPRWKADGDRYSGRIRQCAQSSELQECFYVGEMGKLLNPLR